MSAISARRLSELIDLVSKLPPDRIADVEVALGAARRRAEAVVEVDGAARAQGCPHCGEQKSSRWGTTRSGAHRWRCKDRGRTWTGRTGTPIARIHRPDLMLDFIRDMMGDTPRSCRQLAALFGISRHTAWRWRMLVLKHLKALGPMRLRGIVEIDETRHRESRKGSREWVRHVRDPKNHQAPPRWRWKDWGRKGPPHAVVMTWSENVLATTDRSGAAALDHVADKTQRSIDAALAPRIAPDAMLLFDGLLQFEVMAKARGLSHRVLCGGVRSKTTPRSYHLNTVNGVHSAWKAFWLLFRGPATKNLAAYARWFVARHASYAPRLEDLLVRTA